MNLGPKGNGDINEMDKSLFETVGKFIKQNKDFIYDVRPTENITAEGAQILYDGKYYYAVVFNVPMVANPNVQLLDEYKKYFNLNVKIKDIRWLDDDSPVTLTDKGYYVNTY